MNWFRSLFAAIYDILLGCRHASLTRPFTIEQETYKVCLNCGKQVYYSLQTMRPLSTREVRQMRASRAIDTIAVMPAAAAHHAISSAHNSNAAA